MYSYSEVPSERRGNRDSFGGNREGSRVRPQKCLHTLRTQRRRRADRLAPSPSGRRGACARLPNGRRGDSLLDYVLIALTKMLRLPPDGSGSRRDIEAVTISTNFYLGRPERCTGLQMPLKP
jgi:hypothetical protein